MVLFAVTFFMEYFMSIYSYGGPKIIPKTHKIEFICQKNVSQSCICLHFVQVVGTTYVTRIYATYIRSGGWES